MRNYLHCSGHVWPRHSVIVASKPEGALDAPHRRLASRNKKSDAKPRRGSGTSTAGSTRSDAPDGLPEAFQKRRQAQATGATRQASSFAQQRLALMQAGGATALKDSERRPFAEVVVEAMRQKPGGHAAEDGVEGGEQAGRVRTTRGRGAKKGAAVALLSSHQRVFHAALDLELQEEWLESDERLRTWTRSRLEAEGLAIFGCNCQPDSTLFRDSILRFYVPAVPLPHHNFAPGDIVLVSAGLPTDDSFEGVVLDFSTRWLRVALPTSVAGFIQGGGWRLDLYANTVSYERCHRAVEHFSHPPPAPSPEEQANTSGDDAQAESAAAGVKALLRALAGSVPPGTTLESMAAQPPSWTRGVAGKEHVGAARRALTAVTEELNPSQLRAVEATITRSLTLWQGPPGTGKTRTLLRMLRCAVAALPPGRCALAVAASNVAVDHLVGGLLDLGVRVVRMGQPVKVAPELRRVTLEALVAATPGGEQAVALRRKATTLGGSEGFVLVQQAMQLEEQAAQQVLDGAQVVACTCVGAGDPRLAGRSFPLMVLDEATQATEPAALIAIMAAQVESLVLVGDPQQLPPTVRSPPAADLGLGISLFERLQRMGMRPMLLDTQYRMHPSICEFPSRAFYSGRLRSHPTPQDRPAPPGFDWPDLQAPVCFVPVTSGGEQRTASGAGGSSSSGRGGAGGLDPAATQGSPSGSSGSGGGGGFSYFNAAEARAVVAVVRGLLAGGGLARGASDIGVITPYNGQVGEIQRTLAQLAQRLPASVRGSGTLEGLEAKSVDGFQGREKEVIVFSAVRSNSSGSVGFLSDYRRLNVALTRAKRGLVVVGDPRTLQHDPTWGAWLRWTHERGLWAPERVDRASQPGLTRREGGREAPRTRY